MEIVNEQWRPVKGFEEAYEVSDQGRVRSLERTAPVRGRAYASARFAGRVMKLAAVGKDRNYLAVKMHFGGRREQRKVHRMVAEAFIGPMPSGCQVNHKDGNPLNNAASNLEYVTCRENIRHAHANGLAACVKGERHPGVKLSESKVKEIRLLDGSVPHREIAARYGVSQSTVSAIVTRRLWSHI